MFTLTVRPGRRFTRADLDQRVEAPYSLRWDIGAEKPGDDRVAVRAQPFTAPLLDGGTFDLSQVVGQRPIVLTFWASWCAPCLVEAPHLVRLHEQYGERVEFVAVSIDETADLGTLRTVVSDLALPYAIPLDPDGAILARYANGANIPLTFVFDISGAAVHRHQNFVDGDENALEQAIVQALPPPRRPL